MAKIRGVKPDYWTDEDIIEMSIAARLLFIGMWNFACDNGHLADKPKQIKMRILPGDDVNVAELLREMEAGGRISRADGIITIHNLTRHQRVDKRFFVTCSAPGCTRPEVDSQHKSRRAHNEPPTRARRGPTVTTARPQGDGDVDGDGDSPPTSSREARPAPAPPAGAAGKRDTTPARQLAATLLGIDQADPKLDNLPHILRTNGVRSPGPWLRHTASTGDLEPLLDAAAEDARDPWAHLPHIGPA